MPKWRPPWAEKWRNYKRRSTSSTWCYLGPRAQARVHSSSSLLRSLVVIAPRWKNVRLIISLSQISTLAGLKKEKNMSWVSWKQQHFHSNLKLQFKILKSLWEHLFANQCPVLLLNFVQRFLTETFVIDEQGFTLTVIDDKGYDPYEEDYHKWLDRSVETLEKRHKSKLNQSVLSDF